MKTVVPMASPKFHRLTVENVFHYYNSFSFDWMFLKLADKVDMDKISVKFGNCSDWIIRVKTELRPHDC